MTEILRNMCADALVKQLQCYVILDAVMVVALLNFSAPFCMDVGI